MSHVSTSVLPVMYTNIFVADATGRERQDAENRPRNYGSNGSKIALILASCSCMFFCQIIAPRYNFICSALQQLHLQKIEERMVKLTRRINLIVVLCMHAC